MYYIESKEIRRHFAQEMLRVWDDKHNQIKFYKAL